MAFSEAVPSLIATGRQAAPALIRNAPLEARLDNSPADHVPSIPHAPLPVVMPRQGEAMVARQAQEHLELVPLLALVPALEHRVLALQLVREAARHPPAKRHVRSAPLRAAAAAVNSSTPRRRKGP